MSRLEKYMMNEIALPSWIIRLFDGIKSELAKMTFNEFEKKCEDAYYKILLAILKKLDTTDPENQTPTTYKISDVLGKVFYMVGTTHKERIKDKEFINLLLKTTKNKDIEEELFNLEQELDIPSHLRYHNRNKVSEEQVNEDVAHLWKLVKNEAFPTLAFYPALQVWLEFDKMLKGTPYSGKVIVFYAAFWLILMSGKHIAQWNKWRKENPEQYKAEREVGGGRVI